MTRKAELFTNTKIKLQSCMINALLSTSYGKIIAKKATRNSSFCALSPADKNNNRTTTEQQTVSFRIVETILTWQHIL
jgi:ribosomal protein S11